MYRRLFAPLLGLAVAIGFAASASADDHVTFRLNWLAYGFHAPFYFGAAKGIYHQHGIDIEIGEGQGSGRAVQAVAAGSDMFGLADGTAIISGAAHGAPVQAVMGIMDRSPNGVIVRKDSGITSIQGLKGQTIAATTGEAGLVVFPAVLRSQHLPDDWVRVLRVDGATKLVAVLEKQAVGLLGGVENQALILEQRGLPVTTLLYTDAGVNSIGLAIFTTADREKNNPDLVKRFVAATRASYELAAQQPEEAIKALLAARPTLEHDLSLAQLRAGMTLVKSSYGKDKPIGWMAQQDWEDTLSLMKQYQGLETNLPASSFWTDAFQAP
jgi:NitT/TauT family transport system substrate-binding protein